MATETVDPPVETTPEVAEESPSFDMASAVDKVSASLQSSLFKEGITKEDGPVASASVTPVAETPPITSQAPTVPEVPKSWTKEMQPHWATLPPEVQAYWQTREQQMAEGSAKYAQTAEQFRALQEVIAPFEPLMRQQGVTAPQALSYLLNAHRALSQGTDEQRRAAYEELGRTLRIAQAAAEGTPPPPVDPTVLTLQQQVQQMQAEHQQRKQAEIEAKAADIRKTVDAFANDPAHPHFDAVVENMVPLLQAGIPLQDAYDQAVWANPLTREKSLQDRLLTEQKKLAENARLDALPKVKAAKAHVRSVDTRQTPKEPIGSLDDTLKETLREIRQRAH